MAETNKPQPVAERDLERALNRADDPVAFAARTMPGHVSVADYYRTKLGARLDDPGKLASMPISSPCGADCARAVDAAASVLGHAYATLGSRAYRAHVETLRTITTNTIRVYIYG